MPKSQRCHAGCSRTCSCRPTCCNRCTSCCYSPIRTPPCATSLAIRTSFSISFTWRVPSGNSCRQNTGAAGAVPVTGAAGPVPVTGAAGPVPVTGAAGPVPLLVLHHSLHLVHNLSQAQFQLQAHIHQVNSQCRLVQLHLVRSLCQHHLVQLHLVHSLCQHHHVQLLLVRSLCQHHLVQLLLVRSLCQHHLVQLLLVRSQYQHHLVHSHYHLVLLFLVLFLLLLVQGQCQHHWDHNQDLTQVPLLCRFLQPHHCLHRQDQDHSLHQSHHCQNYPRLLHLVLLLQGLQGHLLQLRLHLVKKANR
ncbi:hypothetical protein EYF80_023313 [Liparis tanakae]|uniref:Uncharacterized protein n=1 Tax=Liparis tanakae TaxID=230148 RepID=A0A4Z2HKU1_9TELE|nr:hypothetical protein EYF80_023313 [Liparis tanakae]